jgi:hypothetical protein
MEQPNHNFRMYLDRTPSEHPPKRNLQWDPCAYQASLAIDHGDRPGIDHFMGIRRVPPSEATSGAVETIQNRSIIMDDGTFVLSRHGLCSFPDQ